MSLRQTQMALGLVTNLASGIRCNNGTMAKPYLAGHGASSGVLAALLAEEGVTANPAAFEGKHGFFDVFSKSTPDERVQAIDQLGERFDIVESGITFKLYPCCAGAHGAVDCALSIANGHRISPEEIESIGITIHAGVKVVLIHPRPTIPAEARFSLEYCVCRALLDRRLGPGQFTPDKVVEREVRALMERVKISYATAPVSKEDLNKSRFPVRITVTLTNGTIFAADTEFAKGTVQNPISQEELEDKFRQCCAGKMTVDDVTILLDIMKNFETLDNIRILLYLQDKF